MLGVGGLIYTCFHVTITVLVVSCRDLRANHSILLLLNVSIAYLLTGSVRIFNLFLI